MDEESKERTTMNPSTTTEITHTRWRALRRLPRPALIATAALAILAVPLATSDVGATGTPAAAQTDRGPRGDETGQTRIPGELSELLGLPPAEIGERLRGGESLAGIAAVEGVARADLAATVQAVIAAKLDAAVAADRITTVERDTLEGLAVGRIDDLIDRSIDDRARGAAGERGRGMALAGPAIGALSDLLGLRPMELAARLRGGESLARIAAAEGVARGELVSAVDGIVDDLLDRAVDADRITAVERAALARLADGRIEWLIDRTSTGRAFADRGGPGRFDEADADR